MEFLSLFIRFINDGVHLRELLFAENVFTTQFEET
jgi:hypothetical protein